MSDVRKIDEANWHSEVADFTVPVVVCFSASWCGPCQRFAPELENLATNLLGQVKVGKVDYDANKALCRNNRITSLPTIAIYMNGREVARIQGGGSADWMEKWIRHHTGIFGAGVDDFDDLSEQSDSEPIPPERI